jgi:hypothetical protein
MRLNALLACLLLILLPYINIVPAHARGGGGGKAGVVMPHPMRFSHLGHSTTASDPFAAFAPVSNDTSASAVSPSEGLVPPFRSPLIPTFTSPLVPPLLQTPTVTHTKVLVSTGKGVFSTQTAPASGVFRFSRDTLTPIDRHVLAPDVVSPQHEVTQSKIIVFQ